MSSRSRITLTIALAAVLGVGGCSGAPSPNNLAAPSSAVVSPSVSVPLPAGFEPATWGIALPASSQHKTPIVTAGRVIFLAGDSVRAVDAQGRQAWSVKFDGYPEDARIDDEHDYPFLRVVSPTTVGVVDGGKQSGSGLSQDGYEVRVTLLSVESGAVVKQVTLPGSHNDSPTPSGVGLAFTLPDGSVTAVMPDGETNTLPSTTTVGGQVLATDGGATVGANTLTIWDTAIGIDSSSSPAGFAGSGWTSVSAAPSSAFTIATIVAGDANSLVVGRWVAPGRTSMDPSQVQFQVLDAKSGKVLSQPSCKSSGRHQFVTSPERRWSVHGPMRLDGAGNATCFGGGTNEKTVTFTAVADDGRAYGTASAGGSQTVLVHVDPNGQVFTEPLPNGTRAPIGILENQVAVFWDPNKPALTGNLIK